VFGVLEWRNCSDRVLERPKKSERMLALVGVAKSRASDARLVNDEKRSVEMLKDGTSLGYLLHDSQYCFV
jgi:hypothetical protein